MLPKVLLPLCLLAYPLAAHEGEAQKLRPADGVPGALFGRSICFSAETLVVGAPGAGAAYVFADEHDAWVEEAKLLPGDSSAGDLFGQSVSVHGDLALVGAPGKSEGALGSGAAYVFVRSGTLWVQEAKLLPANPTAGAAFGTAVSVHGDIAIVGAPQNTQGASGVGTAFVFRRDLGGSWSLEQQLLPVGGSALDAFGSAVSAALDRVAIGSPLANGSANKSGAAYVFARSGSAWSLANKVIPLDGARSDLFGNAVALWQTTLAVGAPGEDSTALNNGASYLFSQSGSSYIQRGKYVGVGAGDRFGGSVSYSYRGLSSGARLDDDEGADSGSMQFYIDLGNRTGYEIFVASDAQPGDLLGSAVASGDCWMAAGAVGADDDGTDSGAVYLYAVNPQITVVNGSGVNPLCMMTTDMPEIGHTWEIQVDTSAYPTAAYTQVMVFYQLLPTPQVTAFGEVFVDRSSALVFGSLLPGSGSILHGLAVPPDPWLIGLELGAQALVRDASFAVLGACNAELARIGCH